MLRPTVSTSCVFVVLLSLATLPVHASHLLPNNLLGRAASKATNALDIINKGGLRVRQQSYTQGNPQYLADVVSWACDTISPDLQDQCVTDLTAAIQDSTVPYCDAAHNELTICLADQPQDCSDSQISYDDCANFTIATYDYCIGLGYTTLPELPDCANSELQGTPVNPYDGSAATTTADWYGYTDSAAATTDTGYGYTDTSAAISSVYASSSTPTITSTATHASTTSIPSVVLVTTSTPVAVPTTQLITYVTIIGTTTIRVTNTTVVPTTVYSLETLTSATRTAEQNTSTILSTHPTTYVTTTTVSGSAVPVTVTSSVVSTICTCAGGCTNPTLPPSANGQLCVRKSRVRLVVQSANT